MLYPAVIPFILPLFNHLPWPRPWGNSITHLNTLYTNAHAHRCTNDLSVFCCPIFCNHLLWLDGVSVCCEYLLSLFVFSFFFLHCYFYHVCCGIISGLEFNNILPSLPWFTIAAAAGNYAFFSIESLPCLLCKFNTPKQFIWNVWRLHDLECRGIDMTVARLPLIPDIKRVYFFHLQKNPSSLTIKTCLCFNFNSTAGAKMYWVWGQHGHLSCTEADSSAKGIFFAKSIWKKSKLIILARDNWGVLC